MHNINLFGRILKMTGCVKYYKDGGSTGHVFRWWHPLSWIMWFVILLICGFVGEKVNEQAPFTIKGYWKEHIKEIEWL
jgi:hypothetical protein